MTQYYDLLGSETCTLSDLELQELCIVNGWFTKYNNDEYAKLFDMNDNSATMRDIAHYIYIHSEAQDESDVYFALAKSAESSVPATSPAKPPKPPKATKSAKADKAPTEPTQTPAKLFEEIDGIMSEVNGIGSETCTISNLELQALCIANNWFTKGNNDEFTKLFDMNDNSATMRDIAHFIFVNSDVEREVDVYVVLATSAKDFAPDTSPAKPPKPSKATKSTKADKAPTKGKQPSAKPTKKADPSRKAGKVETHLTTAAKSRALSKLDVIANNVRKETGNIASSYMRIGYQLWQVKDGELYKAVEVDGKPLKNVYEYCEKAFGFKRSSAANFIAVCEHFSVKKDGNPTGEIDPAFSMFGYTQLSEMLSLPVEKLSEVTPDMTQKSIKALKAVQALGQSSDDSDNDDSEPAPIKRTIAYAGEVTESTYDRILGKLEKLMGKRIQIIVEG